MTNLKLTASELELLRELDAMPAKTLSYSTFSSVSRKAAKLTSRGFAIVVGRLERRNMIARNFDQMALTFGGMRALAAVDA